MGAAHSSNVADAVTNVVNNISQETTTNNTQVQNIESNVVFKNCNTNASSLDITSSATTIQKSNQITSALQNSHVKNDLQQKMLQAAESTVGSLGIGFADSTNSASMMANSSTNISNEMNTVSSQTSNTSNSFTCEDSTFNIAGGFNIDLLSNSDFLSSQTVKANQVASVVNKVSQTADQKAKATVDGIGAALLCLAILIIAIGWSFSKTVKAAADNKGAQKIWQIAGIILFIGLIVAAYFLDWPPFFGKTNECISTGAISGCKETCINLDSDGSIKLESAPSRYTHPITSAFSPSAIPYVNLLEMAIIVSAGDGRINGGYNVTNYKTLKDKIDYANTKYAPLITKSITNFGTMPYLLTFDPKNKVAIPDAFLNNGDSSPSAAACTPGAFNKNIEGSVPIDITTLGTSINGGPLFCPQTGTLPSTPAPTGTSDDYILANINDNGINDWIKGTDLKLNEPELSDTKNARALFARFVLCDIISLIDLRVYVSNTNELVKYNDKDGNPVVTTSDDKDAHNYCYLFKPSMPYDFKSSCTIGGDFVGEIGVCDDKYYKMKKYSIIGVYIALGIAALVAVYLGFKWFMSPNKDTSQ